MSDREMLELAARAAGIEIDKSPFNGGGPKNDGFDIAGNIVLDWHNMKTWNPLADDGDALRLAVKLNLSVVFGANYVIVGESQTPTVSNSGDVGAIVRRAIVRAAAELEKQAGEAG